MNEEENNDTINRIYVIPLTIRVNNEIDEINYINFVLNSTIHFMVSDILNGMYQFYDKQVLTEEDFNKLEIIEEDIKCPICFENKNNYVKINCTHKFCNECLKKWVTEQSDTCPTCRQLINNHVSV